MKSSLSARLTLVVFIAAAFTVAGLASVSSGQNKSRLTTTESRFVAQAYQGGLAEVRMGQLAVQNASSKNVKDFGQKMVDDHTAANRSLSDLASKKHVTLPTDVSAADRAELNRLSKLHGMEFDRQYIAAMVRDHRKDVAEFERESARATEPDLKSWLNSTLPTLKGHLQLATTDNGKLSGK